MSVISKKVQAELDSITKRLDDTKTKLTLDEYRMLLTMLSMNLAGREYAVTE